MRGFALSLPGQKNKTSIIQHNMNLNKEANDNEPKDEYFGLYEKNHRRSKIVGGLLVVGAGVLFLLREMGLWLPSWIFTWQMLLIAIGFYTGVKHSFRKLSWLVLVIMGLAFMIQDFYPELALSKFIWPVVIIFVGLGIILKPASKREDKWKRCKEKCGRDWKYQKYYPTDAAGVEDRIEISAIFGAVKRHVDSKQFRGGEISAVFGGAEVDLSQADFSGVIHLEVNAVFGGTRLIIPANWTIKSELNAVAGSVEDKRPVQPGNLDDSKKVILEGNAVFGGIEIHSY
jgi:predicted membrane protein